MTPEQLSRELRLGSGRFLQQRRKVLGLSLVAAGAMIPISLYQMGVIKHLPEPPLPRIGHHPPPRQRRRNRVGSA